MAGIDNQNLQYGLKTAGAEATRNGDNERISHMNELFKELGLDAKALKKRGPLPQPQADKLVASALFDIGSKEGNGFRIQNLEGIVSTVQERVAPGSYNPEKQFPDRDLLSVIHATDKVRDKMLKGDGRRYDVDGGLGSSLGKAAEGMARGRTPNLGDVFGAVVGLGKAAMNAAGLQPSEKTGPLTLGDIRKAQIALVAHDGVPEADARDALWAFQQMKPLVPKNEQKAFDIAADRVRGNVAKAAGPQVEREVRQDQRQDPRKSPKPAVPADADLGDGSVECSGLQMLEKAQAALTGKKGPNCAAPKVQTPSPSGPGGILGGGG